MTTASKLSAMDLIPEYLRDTRYAPTENRGFQ